MASTNADNPAVEEPIYIENVSRAREHVYRATAADGLHRFPVDAGEEVWMQYEQIPLTPDPALVVNGPAIGVVQLIQMQLQPVAGSTLKFEEAAVQPVPLPPPQPGTPGQLSRVIPATYGNKNLLPGAYQPTLTASVGGVIPYDGHTWVLDGLNRYIEFPYGVPAGYSGTFTLRFYRYTGVTAEGPGAHIWHYVADATPPNLTLCPDPLYPGAARSHFVAPLTAQSTEGIGTRLMFDVEKGAFRAGTAVFGEWDDAFRGAQSVAFGTGTVAVGPQTAISGGSSSFIDASSVASSIGGGVGNSVIGSQESFIGGGRTNVIDLMSFRSAIGGGEANFINQDSTFSYIGAGSQNQISQSQLSCVAGGSVNRITFSPRSFIGGGENHLISSSSEGAFIGGGFSNAINNSLYSTQGGGTNNTMNNSRESFIGGGLLNSSSDSRYSFIGIGARNILQLSPESSIVGGTLNLIQNSPQSFIGGGRDHVIRAQSEYAFIGGGRGHILEDSSVYSSILGGQSNTVKSRSGWSSVLGGLNNTVDATYASIGGGEANETNGTHSSVLGGFANVITTAGAHSSAVGGQRNLILGPNSSVLCGRDNIMRSSDSSVISGRNQDVNQDLTAFAQRLTTSGGRQMRIRTLTNGVTVNAGLDDHFFVLTGRVGFDGITVNLPANPVSGQEYYFKLVGIPPIPAHKIDGNGKNIVNLVGVPVPEINVDPPGLAIHLVFAGDSNRWMQYN